MTLRSLYITLRDRGIGALVSASIGVLRGVFSRNVMGQRYIKRKIYDYVMWLDLKDRGISRSLLLFGNRELDHKIILENALHPGMSVLDIGANIGYYALMMLRLIGPHGTLIAVEPSPTNVRLLKRNLLLNGHSNIEVHQKAVSETDGIRDFFLSEMSNLNTFHNTGTANIHLSGTTIKVETETVQQIAAGRKIDLIRMDVEGHEIEVINGLIPAIESEEMTPMIIFETHLSRYDVDHDMATPLRRLFSLSYHLAVAGSSSERGTKIIESLGYRGNERAHSDGVVRTIFTDIADDDAIELICNRGGVRTAMLAPKS